MALRYIESISSMSAATLNSLRKNFTKLMKTGLEIESFTALVNKNLTDFIYESMIKAGEHEKKAKYLEGNASILSGYFGIGLSAVSFLAGMGAEYKISKSNRGLKRAQSIKSNMHRNKGGAATGKPTKAQNNQAELDQDALKGADLSKHRFFGLRKKPLDIDTKNRLGATARTKYGAQTKDVLKKRKAEFNNTKQSAQNIQSSAVMFANGLSSSIGQIIDGEAKIKAADETYIQALYNAGVEVARNVSEGNRSIGQTEHEMAMRFYDLASGIDRIVDDLDRHSQLRG